MNKKQFPILVALTAAIALISPAHAKDRKIKAGSSQNATVNESATPVPAPTNAGTSGTGTVNGEGSAGTTGGRNRSVNGSAGAETGTGRTSVGSTGSGNVGGAAGTGNVGGTTGTGNSGTSGSGSTSGSVTH